MKHSESMAKIAPALLEVQRKLEAIPKDEKRNNFGKRYTNLGTILRVAKEALNGNDMVILQGGDGSTLNGHLNIETTILHTSGEYISGTFSVPYGDMTPQKAGSAITYARRYSAAALLGMVSEEDDDGEASSVPAQKPAEKKAPSKAVPKPQPKPKPTETRSSEELKAGAVKQIKEFLGKKQDKTIKLTEKEIEDMDKRVEISLKYAQDMKERGAMTDTDFRNVQDLSKVYFDA